MQGLVHSDALSAATVIFEQQATGGRISKLVIMESELNWTTKQLDIKTKSVEQTLEPLVLQVSPCFFRSLLFVRHPSSYVPGHHLGVFQVSPKEKGKV